VTQKMKRIINKKLNKLVRDFRGISPVISTLLLIAIVVVASLVTYAWVMGYLQFTGSKIGESVQIQSITVDKASGHLMVYVQNMGRSSVTFNPDSCLYINGKSQKCTSNTGANEIAPGQTIALTLNTNGSSDPKVTIKFVIRSGGYSEVTVTNPLNNKDTEKIVYVVVCVDSEFYSPNGHTDYIGTTEPYPTLDLRDYSKTQPLRVAQVYDQNFRNTNLDSIGKPVAITWFAEMDYFMSQANYVWADGSSAGVSGYTAIRDILLNTWGPEFNKYGDSIEYHHHFIVYNDGKWKDAESDVGPNYDYQMDAIDRMVLDRGFYPTDWRTGGNQMSPGLSSWLEKWIPFDYTSVQSAGTWYPTHPSGLDRWIVSAEDGTTQLGVNAAFQMANDSGSAIYSFWLHDKNDMFSNINSMREYLAIAAANPQFKNVTFQYVTASEAMQKVLQTADYTPPALTIQPNGNSYTVESNEALWGNHPYVAVKFSDGSYTHIEATSSGNNKWAFEKPTTGQVNIDITSAARGTKGLTIVGATASNSQAWHTADEAIDGDDSLFSYWDSTPGSLLVSPQWLRLDLGSPQHFNNVRTHFYDYDSRTYGYYIEASLDGSTWFTIVAPRQGVGVVWDNFGSIYARFVRITVTTNTANDIAHIAEVNVGATQPSISASTSQAGHIPDLAIDGIDFSYDYWRSTTQDLNVAPQSIIVDLKSPIVVGEVKTHFDDNGNTYTYNIQASIDGNSWSTVTQTKTGTGQVVDSFNPTNMRYVKITVSGNSGGDFAQIQELQIIRIETIALSSIDKIAITGVDLSGNPAPVASFTPP
jgi:flagellin-like protein